VVPDKIVGIRVKAMTKVFELIPAIGVLSLFGLSLLASVQTLSAQDKSPTARTSQQTFDPASQDVGPTNDSVPPAAGKTLEVTRKWLAGRIVHSGSKRGSS
jgi:hypothetical protein